MLKEKTVVIQSGVLRICVRQYADSRWGFDYKPAGEARKKVRCTDLETAKRRAREMLDSSIGRVDRMSIDPQEYAEFLAWKRQRGSACPSRPMVLALLQHQKASGRSPLTTRNAQAVLLRFADAFPGAMQAVTREKYSAWLDSLGVAAPTRNVYHVRIRQLYRFARAEGKISAELCGPELVRPVKTTYTPETYSPDELRALLAAVPHEWLPFVALGAFAGLRPGEVGKQDGCTKQRLQWENILWDRDKIDVPANVSKVGKRRFVPMCEALRAFLAPWRGASGLCVPNRSVYKEIPIWSRAAGVPWKKDALRHSYASYRLALTKDTPALALELGNSVNIIFNHYLELHHEDTARDWFAIRPHGT